MHKKIVATLLTISILSLTACGGKTASPVMIMQHGDDEKSCKQLKYEITHIQNEIQAILPKTDHTAKNVALGVAGAFFLVPWFFMDFKNGEQQEYDALRHRYNHLSSIALQKDCHLKTKQYPTSAEIIAEVEKAKKKDKKNS